MRMAAGWNWKVRGMPGEHYLRQCSGCGRHCININHDMQLHAGDGGHIYVAGVGFGPRRAARAAAKAARTGVVTSAPMERLIAMMIAPAAVERT
mmetsp:Transcript_23487/g.78949  ORF Transcript_23487/g.78949 Transcript_23487/m.78949 type:complete len:94 (+) Transcript_23487:144-425(+)